jgi:hypothetical protein
MAAKAHEISLEAGSKMAAAMKDVINAAAGLSGFVIESARDLVQYMVRRGQMTQEEADKLIREVEAALPKRKATAPAHPPAKPAPHVAAKVAPAVSHRPAPVTRHAPSAAARAASKPAAKKAAAKSKSPSKKPAAKKAAPKKTAPKSSKKKTAAKKPAAKKAKRR